MNRAILLTSQWTKNLNSTDNGSNGMGQQVHSIDKPLISKVSLFLSSFSFFISRGYIFFLQGERELVLLFLFLYLVELGFVYCFVSNQFYINQSAIYGQNDRIYQITNCSHNSFPICSSPFCSSHLQIRVTYNTGLYVNVIVFLLIVTKIKESTFCQLQNFKNTRVLVNSHCFLFFCFFNSSSTSRGTPH